MLDHHYLDKWSTWSMTRGKGNVKAGKETYNILIKILWSQCYAWAKKRHQEQLTNKKCLKYRLFFLFFLNCKKPENNNNNNTEIQFFCHPHGFRLEKVLKLHTWFIMVLICWICSLKFWACVWKWLMLKLKLKVHIHFMLFQCNCFKLNTCGKPLESI